MWPFYVAQGPNDMVQTKTRLFLPAEVFRHMWPALTRPLMCQLVRIVLLLLITVGVYLPVMECEFLVCDDPYYVIGNPWVCHGLSWDGVIWSFTSLDVANWHPLTWLSLMLDRELFGLNPVGFHVTNLAIHILNALLLYWLLHRLSALRDWSNFVIAVLFAIHPLHVESVAWVSQRKDVLFTFFGFLALHAYLNYVRGSRVAYLATLLLFGLSLASKSMLVTFPCLLLLLDHWPLNRSNSGWHRLVWEKLPFFSLSALVSVITWQAQKSAGTVSSLESFPMFVRLANAIFSYSLYLRDTILPSNLSVMYFHPKSDISWTHTAICGVALAVTSLGLFRFRWRWPAAWTGWCWYLGTLVPVVGIVQVGLQQRADRYTYFPLIGVFWGCVWSLEEILADCRWRRAVVTTGAIVVLGFFAMVAHFQVRYWKNSVSLFGRAVAIEPRNPFAHHSLGAGYELRGDPRQAIHHYRLAVQFAPGFEQAQAMLSHLLFQTASGANKAEQQQNAIQSLESLVETVPDASRFLGDMRLELGQYDQAATRYATAVLKFPNDVGLRWNFAASLLMTGRPDEAREQFEVAVGLAPNNPALLTAFGQAELKSGRTRPAVDLLERAAALRPGDVQTQQDLAAAYFSLGSELLNQGQTVEAIGALEKTTTLTPDNWLAHLRLGAALVALNQDQLAEQRFLTVLQLNPQSANAHFGLARLMAASQRRNDAIKHLKAALRIRPDYRQAQELLNSLSKTPTNSSERQQINSP